MKQQEKPGSGKQAKKAAVSAPATPVAPVHVPALFRKLDWFTFAFATLVVMIGYWLTISPEVTLEDSGELAVGSHWAGVPHPPGYPVSRSLKTPQAATCINSNAGTPRQEPPA